MPNLSPGGRETAVRATRLLISLDPDGARTAAVELSQAVGMTVRAVRAGQWVLECQESASGVPASATVRLAARNSPAMVGTVGLTVRSVPVSGGVAAGQEWTVTELQPEGRTALAVLAVTRDDAQNWSITSLLTRTQPLDQDPASVAARLHYGDRDPLVCRTVVGVDRSASMAWAFGQGGDLEQVLRGIWAGLTHATDQRTRPGWMTFGSGLGSSLSVDGLSVATGDFPRGDTAADGHRASQAAAELVSTLRPALYASGCDPAALLATAATSADLALLVTDDVGVCARAGTPNTAVAVVILGTLAGTTRRTADEAEQLAAAAAAGIPVLCLPAGAVDPLAVTRWTLDRLLEASAADPRRATP